MRGCLTLVIGFALGAALMLYWWPRPPHGTAAPSASDIRVQVSDGYLSRMVAARATTIQFPSISHVSILSNPPNTLVLHADASAGPVAAPLVMEIQPVVQGGRIHAQVISASLAGIPVPGQLTGIVEQQINGSLNNFGGAGLHITGATVTTQGVEVTANRP